MCSETTPRKQCTAHETLVNSTAVLGPNFWKDDQRRAICPLVGHAGPGQQARNNAVTRVAEETAAATKLATVTIAATASPCDENDLVKTLACAAQEPKEIAPGIGRGILFYTIGGSSAGARRPDQWFASVAIFPNPKSRSLRTPEQQSLPFASLGRRAPRRPAQIALRCNGPPLQPVPNMTARFPWQG